MIFKYLKIFNGNPEKKLDMFLYLAKKFYRILFELTNVAMIVLLLKHSYVLNFHKLSGICIDMYLLLQNKPVFSPDKLNEGRIKKFF